MKKKLGNNGEPIESEEYRDIKFDEMKEKPQPQEAWVEGLDNKIQYILDAGFSLQDYETADMLGSFIRALLEAQQGELYAWFNEALLKQKKEWMDVSSWKNLGEKYGYFKFFENKIKKEIIEEIEKVIKEYTGKGDLPEWALEEVKRRVVQLNQ